MLFSSLTFLFVFLPIVLITYYLVKPALRNSVLLFASLFFYAWGEPTYLIIMLATIVINYIGARCIEAFSSKKLALAGTIAVDLAFLGYFKYYNFFVENINAIFSSNIDFVEIALPIGISFYTFQSISYLVDVYRGDAKAQKDIYKLALYICLFPQLIAGPIVKYHDVEEQINDRNEDFDKFKQGVKRFIIGLSKKVLIANTLAAVVDKVYGMQVEFLTSSAAWLGAILYPLQLFFDFSGYSDMAIGLGLMFGFTFKENFNFPYIAKSITEFWRRWHISLSTWFKEYLYIPLGGNRKGPKRQLVNIGIVFFFTGMWHGASWNFVVWGMWHGLFNIIEKATGWNKDKESKGLTIVQHIYTLFVVMIGWILFRADSFSHAWKIIRRMFFIKPCDKSIYELGYYITFNTWIFLFIAIALSAPLFDRVPASIKENRVSNIAVNCALVALFALCISSLVSSSYNPFIYFRF
ncbi:MAG: MBOAT family protein [Paludibacteraceae bacterium]|nr:MBOAT family protein [Paludibacteraceae bacterium]